MSDLTNQGAIDAATGILTLYGSGTSRIGLGDSATVFQASQTALQGANKAYKATTTATQSSNRLTFTSTFTTSEANGFTVREIGVDRTSVLLVRNVLAATIGPKTSSEEWTVVINVDFTAG